VEFLGDIDRRDAVDRILVAARDDPDPSIRMEALKCVAAQPWDAAQPILKRASEADPDAAVREYARQALEGHTGRTTESPSADFVQHRIESMMQYIIMRSEFVEPDGVSIRTVPLASNEEIEEISHYGDRAIPALSAYLLSQDGRQKNVAMRLLGAIGTDGVIEPLKKVAQTDPSPTEREIALRWLLQAPVDLASPIIRQAASDDPDPMVRKTARGLLNARGDK